MVAESLWGSEALPFTVRTKHGPARIPAFHFKGHQILILAQSHEFRLVDKQGTVRLPEGVAFIQNKDLSRRTNKRVTHQIVTDGIYDLFRSLTHVVRGEKREVSDMREMRQLTFDFIGAMRAWGVLTSDERDTAISLFSAMGEELDAPKRNQKKLTASARYQKAANLKTSRGKTAPMPAAITASAGAHHLGKRSKEAREIAGFFTPRRLELYERIEVVHQEMDGAWSLFHVDALASSFNAIGLAAARPTGATKRVAREKIEALARSLGRIRVLPYIGLIDRLLEQLRVLYKGISTFVPSKDDPRLELEPLVGPIRSSLQAMRLIRCIEMELIMPLAFLERRWKRWNEDRRTEVIALFKTNFSKAYRLLETLREEELPEGAPALARGVFAKVSAFTLSSADSKEARKSVRESKKLLKELVRELS